ncbi:DUF262 domain-containing protein [Guyparkeria hydrothermalis]|uniref:DUF262 domain-containing protein n=1 Tax=Guyparkeria hydrothermalis TaxID=923 RepID=UPI0020218381|nr:DUF262 domain-containing protein [Guyparkeria hydrothermalis]MCL7744252.1 DUF262 domain-containing protein [Guyparkeria hydrothermalis]
MHPTFPDLSNEIDIGVKTVDELPGPLHLDTYQRPYVWDEDKVRQLVDDLESHQDKHGTEEPYYMGTLLLHAPEEAWPRANRRLNVIDGQQRLTTLALISRIIFGAVPDSIQFRFGSNISHQHIRQAHDVLQQRLRDVALRLDKLSFTVIAVRQEDLAFAFFDTQNNRGVPLATTDLLKAYHLRAVQDDQAPEKQESIQRMCARRWEEMQVRKLEGEGVPINTERGKDPVSDLFHYYLWRARSWRGQRSIVRESRNQLLDHFQTHSSPAERIDSIPLYPTPGNQLASSLRLGPEGDTRLDTAPIRLTGNPANLPFSLRQPIHEGLGFFLYAAKYSALERRLFWEKPNNHELSRYQTFYQSVAAHNSPYLRQLHRLAVLMYHDQFGEDGLLKFSWALEYVLGAIRMAKQRVFKRAPMKYLEEANHNLLDVIASAYRPEEVMSFLMRPEHRIRDEQTVASIFRSMETQPEDSVSEINRVQQRYYDRLRKYFVEDQGVTSLEFQSFRKKVELAR